MMEGRVWGQWREELEKREWKGRTVYVVTVG